jgi:hypothetical protein
MQKNEKKQEFKGGMLLYPKKYFIEDSNEDLSYCYGVNEYGKEVIFYLNPTEQARESARASSTGQTIPNFEEFSDEDRRATKPCNANEANCPKTPYGILMMEQVSPKEEHPLANAYPNVPVYEAKWASILREGDYMEVPPIGFGYMEIGYHPKVNGEVDDLRLQYQEVERQLKAGMISEVDAEEKKESLYVQITARRQKWFVGVVVKHKLQATMQHKTKEEITSYLGSYLTKYTSQGIYGGAMIRVRKNDVVDSNLSCYCNMSYDYRNKCVKDINSVINDWFKFNGNRILKAAHNNPDIYIDIIPTQRINFAKMSTDKYSKDLASMGSKIMKTYVDKKVHFNPDVNFFKDKVFLLSKIGIRLAKAKKGESKGNLLGSTIHSFSSPMGNIFSVDSSGEMKYKMDFSERQDSVQHQKQTA